MRRSLLVFLTLIVLSACATLVTGRPEYQQLLVTQRYDAAYIRAQAVAVGLGLQIVRTQDTAHIFTAKRPASGEEVTQFKKFLTDTASSEMGINLWLAPQISEH
jgi:uncharacterized protein YceK